MFTFNISPIISGLAGVGLLLLNGLFFWNPAGTATAIQYPWGGDKMVNTQGLKVKAWGRTIPLKYEISMKDIIVPKVFDERSSSYVPGELPESSEGIYNRRAHLWEFSDAIKAEIGVSVIAGVSIDDEAKFLNMADRNGSESKLVIGRILPNIDAAIKNTCKLMDAQEYISGKASDFDRYFQDQLENGMYLVEEYTVINPNKFQQQGDNIIAEPGKGYIRYGGEWAEIITKAEQAIFKKGDYIVVKKSSSDAFNSNHCLKIREDYYFLRVEKDTRDNRQNGWTACKINDEHKWRKVTSKEKAIYDSYGKPYDITKIPKTGDKVKISRHPNSTVHWNNKMKTVKEGIIKENHHDEHRFIVQLKNMSDEYVYDVCDLTIIDSFTEEETVELKSKDMSEFKKDDYIVITGNFRKYDKDDSEFKRHYCYKQRQDNKCISVYKDCKDESNGWGVLSFKDESNWRYATVEEIIKYDEFNKPFDTRIKPISKITISDEDGYSKFKHGDEIIVAEIYRDNPECRWVTSMNDYVGHRGTVNNNNTGNITINFITCKNHPDDYTFPHQSLRLVSNGNIHEYIPVDPDTILSKKVKQKKSTVYTTPIVVEPIKVKNY